MLGDLQKFKSLKINGEAQELILKIPHPSEAEKSSRTKKNYLKKKMIKQQAQGSQDRDAQKNDFSATLRKIMSSSYHFTISQNEK